MSIKIITVLKSRTRQLNGTLTHVYIGILAILRHVFESRLVHDLHCVADVHPHNVDLPAHLVPVTAAVQRIEDAVGYSGEGGTSVGVDGAGSKHDVPTRREGDVGSIMAIYGN